MDNDSFNKAILKSDEVSKEDLIRLGEEYGIEFPKRISKERVILKLLESELQERIKEEFKEFVLFPNWVIADYYKINTSDLEKLEKLKIFNEDYKMKSIYFKSSKQSADIKHYYYTAFGYDKLMIKESLESLKEKGYNIRIETETEKEVEEIKSQLRKIFNITWSDTYEKRNSGYYTYFKILLLKDNEIKKNELLAIIEEKEKEIEQLKEEKMELKREKKETQRELNLLIYDKKK